MADQARDLPKTDKGLQAYVANIRPPAIRTWLAVGSGLTVCLEPSGAKTFQARIRRQGETNPRRVRIGSFPALSVADARRKLGTPHFSAALIHESAWPAHQKEAAVQSAARLCR